MTADLRLVASLTVDNASKYKHKRTAKGWSFTSFSGRINIIQYDLSSGGFLSHVKSMSCFSDSILPKIPTRMDCFLSLALDFTIYYFISTAL